MNGSSDRASLQRHAALLAHALDDGDQRWLLDALAPAQRARLLPLLDELRALGLPRQRERIVALGESGAAAPPLEALDDARKEAVLVLLDAEPEPLVRWVLALRDWPGSVRLRARHGLHDAATSDPPAPDRDAWLLHRLVQLGQLQAPSRPSPLAGWLQRWRAGRPA